jgi:tRNA-(ms[2]io[6]A)-hydroxylase
MPSADIAAVLAFLPCRTPAEWVEKAVSDLDSLLHDHASLELKAAAQAQKLISQYGAAGTRRQRHLKADFRSALINRMSRLAREELRHFEQVVALIEQRGGHYTAITPSRYAAGMHSAARKTEPEALVDALVIGAIIEARSCERFYSLVQRAESIDWAISKFYTSLLKSEARHFEDYLALARRLAAAETTDRIAIFLAKDAQLIESPDSEFRFLGGRPLGSVGSTD